MIHGRERPMGRRHAGGRDAFSHEAGFACGWQRRDIGACNTAAPRRGLATSRTRARRQRELVARYRRRRRSRHGVQIPALPATHRRLARSPTVQVQEALVLVFLVMYLFLQNFRATLIPTIAVPVVLLGTLDRKSTRLNSSH